MGMNLVLLETDDSKDILEYLYVNMEWVWSWFGEIYQRRPSLVDTERLVWVKCFGISAQVWGTNFFQMLTSPFGEFMRMNEAMKRMERYDISRWVISMPSKEVINLVYRVQNELFYEIKIQEEGVLDEKEEALSEVIVVRVQIVTTWGLLEALVESNSKTVIHLIQ
ncbi:hypothetical protein VNO78_00491 [Psophocarpus tetragonolobus]|uniref:DUF4283 domain-containing protein n=1 Tax=Psophocarpus tetragonolobus TaxID=3891 RepID=A0AAN9T0F8_PSOTE